MPMLFWWALLACLAAIALFFGLALVVDAVRGRRIARARAAMNRATVTHLTSLHPELDEAVALGNSHRDFSKWEKELVR